ncbi:MAG: SIR2 family protein, partial [Planctomycetota bacterium]
HGKAALEAQFLSNLHAGALPSLVHYQLLSLPWAAIFTTNYDTLVETTLDALRVKASVITHDEQIATLDETDALPVVKVHGGFCSPDCGVLPRDGRKHMDVAGRLAWDLVATRDDYDSFFERRPAIAAYLEAKLLTCPGVIVGYGISDPHLRQLFARIGGVAPASARPRLLCVSNEASPIEDYWKRRGLRTLVVPLGDGGANYRDFVDAAATSAQVALDASLVPEHHLDARWDEITKGLEGSALLTLITSLVEAGCRPPSPEILARAVGGGEADALARLHLSPERVSWLNRRRRSNRGPL